MSTLASAFLKSEFRPEKNCSKELNKLHLWTHDFIKARLKAPLPGSDLRLQSDQCAERYIFNEDAPAVTRALIENGSIEKGMVLETFRMPATNVWLEFTPNDSVLSRIGYMVGPVPESESILTNYRLMIAIAAQSKNNSLTRTVGLLSLPEGGFNLRFGATLHLHWFMDYMGGGGRVSKEQKEIDSDAKMFFYDFVEAMFLINTPRVCELREASFGPRKQKIRDRTGLPLVEYRRVVMKIGVGTPQYRSNGSRPQEEVESEANRRRLHRVVGHFRTYKEGREKPKVSFVPQHWRGNAELGILLHEREVKR